MKLFLIIMDLKVNDFENFKVHNADDSHAFVHVSLGEKDFFEKIAAFILNEDNFLRFIENNTSIEFSPSEKNYARLYKQLDKFIDDDVAEYVELDITDDLIKNIIIDENPRHSTDGGKLKIRLSKIGRIGEYIFHLILSNYFKFDCIIPKISLTTNKEMPVFGIDALFLCHDRKMLLFGESKVTNKLSNGINLINKSLDDYEKSIRSEFLLTLSESQIKKNGLTEAFGDLHETCISFDEFIARANVDTIGIPVFILHGVECDVNDIISSMERTVHKKKFFGLNTIYYVISLPVISKSDFIKYLTIEIKKKMSEYDERRKKI